MIQNKAFVLFENDDLLTINKPLGIETQSINKGSLGLVEWFKLHQDVELYPIYNLPKSCSGIVVFSKGEQTDAHITLSDIGYTFLSKNKGPGTKALPLGVQFTQLEGSDNLNRYVAKPDKINVSDLIDTAKFADLPILSNSHSNNKKPESLYLHLNKLKINNLNQIIECPLPNRFNNPDTHAAQFLELHFCQDRRLDFLDTVTQAYRIVHRGEYKGIDFAVERYGDYLSVWSYDEKTPADQVIEKLSPLIRQLMDTYCSKSALIRLSNRDPHKKKLVRQEHWIGEPATAPFLLKEHGLNYEIQLAGNKHTGLFLDQRDARRRIAKISKGKRVANLFSFTCSFSQAAIQAGAEVVFSVDLAKGCLNVGKRNLAANGLDAKGIGKFVQEDVIKWLERQIRRKAEKPGSFVPFDIIICDPPVFAGGRKGKAFSVEAQWASLVEGCTTILSKDGIALFANNHRSGIESHYRNTLKSHFSRVTPLSPPLDFPETGETHVRSYWCEK